MTRGRLLLYRGDGIEVRRDPDRPTGRLLVIDGMESSYVDLDDPTHLEFSYVRRLRDVIDVTRGRRSPLDVVHLGGGGLTLPRYLAATRPRARSLVFEHDPQVVAVARAHLGLQTSARVRLRVADARAALARRPTGSADMVVGDAFVGGLVPPGLSTVEFAEEVARVLRPGGGYLLNVVDAPRQRVGRRAAATLLKVFPTVSLLAERRVQRGRGTGNLVFVTGDRDLPADELKVRAARDGDPLQVLSGEEVVWYAAGARPVTDDEVGLPVATDRRRA